jgi:uncharacterized delta-60 repeat protein
MFSSITLRLAFASVAMLCLALFIPQAHAGSADLDPTFDGDGRVTTEFNGPGNVAYAIALQPNGKIVAAGEVVPIFTGEANSSDFGVARYNADGSLDAGFGNAGKVTADFNDNNDYAYAVAVQADGRIIVAGTAGSETRNFDIALVRYNPDGSLDATFGAGGKVLTSLTAANDIAHAMVLQPDGKIVVAGRGLKDFETRAGDFVVVRYQTNGSLDSGFGQGGVAYIDFTSGAEPSEDVARALVLQPDGKIVVAGSVNTTFDTSDTGVARLHTNGSLDDSFNLDGKITANNGLDDPPRALAVQPDRRIVVAGYAQRAADDYDFILLRFDEDGSPDPLFGTAGRVFTDFNGSYDVLYGIVLQPDGRIVAAGGASDATFNDIDFGLVRYNPDGSLDLTFGNGGKSSTPILNSLEIAYALAQQPDGRLVAAGYADLNTGWHGDFVFALARFGGPQTREKCSAPGVAVVDDPVGDQTGAPANSQLDIRRISFAEPYFQDGTERFVLTMKVADLTVLPPNTEWDIAFTVPAGTRHFVRMTTRGATAYQYGRITVGGARVIDGPADDGSFVVNGTIAITIAKNKVGSPTTGQPLTAIGGQTTSYLTGPQPIAVAGDTAGGAGGYNLIGNFFCRPQTAPTARLTVSPASGNVPVEVTLDGTASSDPDAGDTLVSYTFDFGDGSPTVTQSTPIISHTYTQPRTTSARLTVTDSRGAVSASASVPLSFTGALVRVVSRKTHGDAGPFDVVLFPVAQAPGIECRSEQPSGSHHLVFTFANAVTISDATVTPESGQTGERDGPPVRSADGREITVNLRNVSDVQTINVTLLNVNDGTSTANLSIGMGVLRGDANGDRAVNSGDALQTRNRSGQVADTTNFRSDVNTDGSVNSGDALIVRGRSGSSLSTAAPAEHE